MTTDVFTGNVLCWRPDCQWKTPRGVSGIEARYTDASGRPVCWDHYGKPKKKPKQPRLRVVGKAD